MASSDVMIRNVYREVTGQGADDTVLRAARSIPDNQLKDFFRSGGVERYANDPANIIRQMTEEIMKPYEEADRRAKEFDEQNPFVFDEVQARASAEERFDPFYEAELRDFLTGVNRQRNRTVQDEEALRQELTTSTENLVGRTRREIDMAKEASREGFAGAGLFFGGQRLRREGTQDIQGNEQVGDIMRNAGIKQNESNLRQSRTLEDLASGTSTYQRKLGAEKETNVLTDIEGQRSEALKRREIARQNAVGYPLATGTSSLNLLLGA